MNCETAMISAGPSLSHWARRLRAHPAIDVNGYEAALVVASAP